MKFKIMLKYLFSCSLICLPTLNLFSCSSANHFFNNKTNLSNYENKDAFLDSAKSLAKSNNVIVYSIGYYAIAHKYGMIAHALKVLQQNPDQTIYIYISSLSPSDVDVSFFDQFKNVKIKFLDLNFDDVSQLWVDFKYYIFEQFLNDINNNFDDKKNYHLFCDDFQIIRMSKQKPTKSQHYENFVKSFYQILKNFNSINMIADGTASAQFWNNSYYQKFQNEFLELDKKTNMYQNAIKEMSRLKMLDEKEFLDWSKQSSNNPGLFLSMLTTLYSYDNKNYPQDLLKTNFFVPTTNMIKDVNNTSSKVLTYNDKFNEYFDPYFSLNLNFLSLFRNLNLEFQNIFLSFFKITINKQEIENKLNNAVNIVYSGRKLISSEIINQQAMRLIKLNEIHKNDGENVKIWFKGHPNDSNDIYNVLANKIQEITGEFPKWFNVLEKSIPIEFYISTGILKSDNTKNKVVKLYTTFSTFVLFLETDNQYDLIQKILVSEKELEDINFYFGNLNQSICFNENKVIKDSDFFGN